MSHGGPPMGNTRGTNWNIAIQSLKGQHNGEQTMSQSLARIIVHLIYSTKHRQGGYGAFSVSPAHAQKARAYILDQENHHREVTFQDEFRKFLKDYDVEYDERYVWD